MKQKWKKSTWIILASASAAFLIALIVVLSVNSGLKYYDFFYPDSHYQKLGHESRAIRAQDKSGSSLELRLMKEYILGPIHYSLKLVIRDDITIKNVWSAQDKTVYINFNEGFGRYIQDNGAECEWFIRGLKETLRVNTPFENMILLVNDNQIHEKLGEFRLSEPVRIRSARK